LNAAAKELDLRNQQQAQQQVPYQGQVQTGKGMGEKVDGSFLSWLNRW